jgi:hypothetical protein
MYRKYLFIIQAPKKYSSRDTIPLNDCVWCSAAAEQPGPADGGGLCVGEPAGIHHPPRQECQHWTGHAHRHVQVRIFMSSVVIQCCRSLSASTKNPDPHPDPHQGYKLDPDPDPDPHRFADVKPKYMEYEQYLSTFLWVFSAFLWKLQCRIRIRIRVKSQIRIRNKKVPDPQ